MISFLRRHEKPSSTISSNIKPPWNVPTSRLKEVNNIGGITFKPRKIPAILNSKINRHDNSKKFSLKAWRIDIGLAKNPLQKASIGSKNSTTSGEGLCVSLHFNERGALQTLFGRLKVFRITRSVYELFIVLESNASCFVNIM